MLDPQVWSDNAKDEFVQAIRDDLQGLNRSNPISERYFLFRRFRVGFHNLGVSSSSVTVSLDAYKSHSPSLGVE